jgi:hypothetical protein
MPEIPTSIWSILNNIYSDYITVGGYKRDTTRGLGRVSKSLEIIEVTKVALNNWTGGCPVSEGNNETEFLGETKQHISNSGYIIN